MYSVQESDIFVVRRIFRKLEGRKGNDLVDSNGCSKHHDKTNDINKMIKTEVDGCVQSEGDKRNE